MYNSMYKYNYMHEYKYMYDYVYENVSDSKYKDKVEIVWHLYNRYESYSIFSLL